MNAFSPLLDVFDMKETTPAAEATANEKFSLEERVSGWAPTKMMQILHFGLQL